MGTASPAAEPNPTWSVACRRGGSFAADSPAKGLVDRTVDSQVDLDTADLAADSPGSVHAAGTGHAAAGSPGSAVPWAPAAAVHRDVPVALEPAVLDWVPFARPTKSTAADLLVVARHHPGNLRPVVAVDSAAAPDGPDLWAADLRPGVVPGDLAAVAAAAATAVAAVAVVGLRVALAELHCQRELPAVDWVLPVDQDAPGRRVRDRTEDHSELPVHPEERHALADHCRAGGHVEAEVAPGCCAADRPNSPDKPGSDATLHGTTCTRWPCPYSGSPGWSGSGPRSRPESSGCASDSVAEVALHAASVRRAHPGYPGWAVAGIVAAASTRPTCLFSFGGKKKVSNSGRNFNRLWSKNSLFPVEIKRNLLPAARLIWASRTCYRSISFC